MMNVYFRKKLWKVECPKDLKFPPGVIRNVLLSRGKEKVITNISEIKRTKQQFLF
jgi:hypothetical protein